MTFETPVRVSVVLPVRNGERFLADAIQSILSQTFTDLELLVVDDGSSDGTLTVAHRYARMDSRVRVLSRPPLGLVAALNAGVRAARGSYVARMDADDVSRPDRLTVQVAYLDRHPLCVVLGSGVDVVDADGRPLRRLQLPHAHDDIANGLLEGLTRIAHPTVVMRRGDVENVGGYAEGTFPCEDHDLWLRLSVRGRLANVGECLLTYRRSAQTVQVQAVLERPAALERVVNRAREARGLPAWSGRLSPFRRLTPQGRYHVTCAFMALGSGHRRLAAHHSLRGLGHDPGAWQLYATLVGVAIPRWLVPALANQIRRIQPHRNQGEGLNA